MPLYLGLDSSTQSLSAIVVEVDAGVRRVVFEDSLAFDQDFPPRSRDRRSNTGACT